MNSILKYNGYEGTAEIDMERGVCRGRILFVSDLVTYEAETPANLQREFEAAVVDYLQTCEELGRKPQKPLCGQFNVRTTPQVHKDARRRAVEDGTSLNDVVGRALNSYLYSKSEVTNHNYLLVGDESVKNTLITAAISNNSEYGVGTSVRAH